MILDEITLHHVRMPLVAPFTTSFGEMRDRECIIIEAKADGLVGWGECVASEEPTYSPETIETAWHISRDFIAPLINSLDLNNASDYSQQVKPIRGHNMAKAGIEMALWDIWGKEKGQPLAELVGGIKRSVSVGVSVGIQSSIAELLRVATSYLNVGYGRVKIKIKPGRDVAECAAVRDAFPDLPLQVDANSAYTLDNCSSLKPLDGLGLLLIEQPLGDEDLWDHHLMQKEFNTRICLDESIISLDHARHALAMDAARVINIKQGRVGGLGPSLQIHDLCVNNDVPVWCGGMLETGIGRAANLALASLPGFTLPGDISATERYYHQDIIEERFKLNEDSTINVPDGHGLGVTIDPDALAAFTLRSETISLKR